MAGFFTEPLKPNTGKPCENSLKTHLIVLLFFQGECDPKRFDVGTVLGMRQQRTGKSVDRRPVSFCDRFLCDALCYKTSQNCSRTKRVWSLALSEDLFSEPEERKKSRAGRGSVCNLASQSH